MCDWDARGRPTGSLDRKKREDRYCIAEDQTEGITRRLAGGGCGMGVYEREGGVAQS
jgi:hypothetical protein